MQAILAFPVLIILSHIRMITHANFSCTDHGLLFCHNKSRDRHTAAVDLQTRLRAKQLQQAIAAYRLSELGHCSYCFLVTCVKMEKAFKTLGISRNVLKVWTFYNALFLVIPICWQEKRVTDSIVTKKNDSCPLVQNFLSE